MEPLRPLLSVARLSAQKNSTRIAPSKRLRYARIAPRRPLKRSLPVTITRQLQEIYSLMSARIYNLIKSGVLSAETIFPRIVCGREPPQFRRDKSYARAWRTKPSSLVSSSASQIYTYVCTIISRNEKFSPFSRAFSSLSTRISNFHYLRCLLKSWHTSNFQRFWKYHKTSKIYLLLTIALLLFIKMKWQRVKLIQRIRYIIYLR